MDYGTMDSHYVCDLCDISFSRDDALKRHMESKHGQDMKQGHTCGECGKRFSRKDALRRHQLTCQAIRFKCSRCHRVLKDIASLTRHMPGTHMWHVSGGVCRPGSVERASKIPPETKNRLRPPRSQTQKAKTRQVVPLSGLFGLLC